MNKTFQRALRDEIFQLGMLVSVVGMIFLLRLLLVTPAAPPAAASPSQPPAPAPAPTAAQPSSPAPAADDAASVPDPATPPSGPKYTLPPGYTEEKYLGK